MLIFMPIYQQVVVINNLFTVMAFGFIFCLDQLWLAAQAAGLV